MAGPFYIYSDGACSGNPGPGGWGAIIRLGERVKEFSGGYRHTTNNRMEIMAAIKALEALNVISEPCHVVLYSDSKYLVDSVSRGWVNEWRENGWRRVDGKRAGNADLWERLLELCERHTVEFNWVRSHSGVEDNERCDRLAKTASKSVNLPDDEGYGG